MTQVQFYEVNGAKDNEYADGQEEHFEEQGICVNRQQAAVQDRLLPGQHHQGKNGQPNKTQHREPAQQFLPVLRQEQVNDEDQESQPGQGELRRQQIKIVS